eukprot:3302554-Amphidinium_carterae.1
MSNGLSSILSGSLLAQCLQELLLRNVLNNGASCGHKGKAARPTSGNNNLNKWQSRCSKQNRNNEIRTKMTTTWWNSGKLVHATGYIRSTLASMGYGLKL